MSVLLMNIWATRQGFVVIESLPPSLCVCSRPLWEDVCRVCLIFLTGSCTWKLKTTVRPTRDRWAGLPIDIPTYRPVLRRLNHITTNWVIWISHPLLSRSRWPRNHHESFILLRNKDRSEKLFRLSYSDQSSKFAGISELAESLRRDVLKFRWWLP